MCVYTPMVIIECVCNRESVIERVCIYTYGNREYVCVYIPMVIEGMYRCNREKEYVCAVYLLAGCWCAIVCTVSVCGLLVCSMYTRLIVSC